MTTITAGPAAPAAEEEQARLTALEGSCLSVDGLQRQAVPWWLVLLCGLASQAARATHADRGRTALLAAVSHDLRGPLAAAKAAVSGLRSRDACLLTQDDRGELLAAAEESLDRLAQLAASLLDVSRLQAGGLAVFPRPADLGEIVADALDGLGPQARTVMADIPPGLPEVMADPAITERVIANLAGNALRYAPATPPPLVTATALGDRVQLRVVDHGPGIPEAERKRLFLPFHRLGDPSDRTGVGLGLVVSRGLTEAMGGTVEPEETPGGGLTMVVSLPVAPARPTAVVSASWPSSLMIRPSGPGALAPPVPVPQCPGCALSGSPRLRAPDGRNGRTGSSGEPCHSGLGSSEHLMPPRVRVRPKAGAVRASGCRVVLVVCVPVRAGAPRAGRGRVPRSQPVRRRALTGPGDR